MKATTGIEKAVLAVPPVTVGKGKNQKTLTRQAALGARLRVSQQAVSMWVRRGWAPDKRASKIADMTGVPLLELLSSRSTIRCAIKTALKNAEKVAA